jgi:hypothetical protein
MMKTVNERMEALVTANDEEVKRLKTIAFEEIICESYRPLVDKFVTDEDHVTLPLVAWGRYEKYESKGESFTFGDFFVPMSQQFDINQDNIELLKKMDKAVVDDDVLGDFYIPEELLTELYGGDKMGTTVLVLEYHAGDDKNEEEFFVTTTDGGDWE